MKRRISHDEYVNALAIIEEYKSQQFEEHRCCDGPLKAVYEENAFPYGDNLRYDLCERCGKKYNVRIA